jgi:hypothetical protein
MGYEIDQVGNCVFHISMGWREHHGGNAVVSRYRLSHLIWYWHILTAISLTVTKEGNISFMDELDVELRNDFETAWSLFCENKLQG